MVAANVKANAARDKRERLEELLITVRIAKEARAFKSFAAFQYAIEQIIQVCRQNEGWLRAMRAMQGATREPASARTGVRAGPR